MERLLAGVSRFQREVFPRQREVFEELASKQNPRALFITCSDSRVVPDLMTQSGPGDLFICRNAGNMIPPYGNMTGGVSATIEYAVLALNIEHIIICGHSDCGAMKGVLYPETVADMPTVRDWLAQGEMARRIVREAYPEMPEAEMLDVLVKENVVAQLEHLKTHPSVASRLATGRIGIHGWVFHIHQGRIEAWDAEQGRFVPIDEYDINSATPKPRIGQAGRGPAAVR